MFERLYHDFGYMFNDELLLEYSQQDLKKLYDDDFLSQKQREAFLKKSTLENWNGNIAKFNVPSSIVHKNNRTYDNLVKFLDLQKVIEDEDLNPNEAARMLIWVGDIQLHCTCPSFKYHGYQYLLTVLDSSVYPETRRPKKMNPRERGIVCKHLRRTLNVLPFYSGDIARKVKQEREKQGQF